MASLETIPARWKTGGGPAAFDWESHHNERDDLFDVCDVYVYTTHFRPSAEEAIALPSESTQRTRTPVFGSRAASVADRLWSWVEADPAHVMRKTLYIATALTAIGSMFVVIGAAALSLIAATAVFILWGGAALLVYSISGRAVFDPRLGFVLSLVGLGVLAIAIASIVRGG